MDKFFFFNISLLAFNIFIIVYAYSLNFFPKKWRKKVNQDTLVGLALIFITMLTMFSWVIYFYLKIFSQKPLSLQCCDLKVTSPTADRIEYNVSASSFGPATFAKSWYCELGRWRGRSTEWDAGPSASSQC